MLVVDGYIEKWKTRQQFYMALDQLIQKHGMKWMHADIGNLLLQNCVDIGIFSLKKIMHVFMYKCEVFEPRRICTGWSDSRWQMEPCGFHIYHYISSNVYKCLVCYCINVNEDDMAVPLWTTSLCQKFWTCSTMHHGTIFEWHARQS